MKEIEIQIKLGTAYYYFIGLIGSNIRIYVAHTSSDKMDAAKAVKEEYEKGNLVVPEACAIEIAIPSKSNIIAKRSFTVCHPWQVITENNYIIKTVRNY